MNARFWVWENDGLVKLTLKPGQSLSWSKGGPYDEGWSAEYRTWKWDGRFLVETDVSDGCDCDGRVSRRWQGRCHAFNMRKRPAWKTDKWVPGHGPIAEYHEGIFYPEFQTVQEGQRDYSAEAAGY